MRFPSVRLVLFGLVAGVTSPAVAQEAGSPADVTIFSPTTPRSEQGVAVEGWMLYPSFFGGYTFTDNAYATPTNRVALSGVQVAPSIEANQDNGLHKTNVSVGAAAVIYPGAGGQDRTGAVWTSTIHDAAPSNVSGHAAVTHIWTPTEDWTVWITGNFVRNTGLFGASPSDNGFGVGTPGVTAFSIAPAYIPSIGTFSAQQQYSNQYGGQASVEKKINERISLRLTGYAQGVSYDSTPSATQLINGLPVNISGGSGENGLSYGATLRGSFYATPQIYVYGEPGLDLRRYDSYTQDSNGYRVTAGLGSNMISLFQGEIYGGYQGQTSVYGFFGNYSAPAYGARIRYFPTPGLTATLTIDTTLGAIQPTRVGITAPLGYLAAATQTASVSVTQQAQLQFDYALNAYTALSARGGYGETRTSAIGYTDQIWSAGASVAYNFWRNTSVLLSYGFTKTSVLQSQASLLTSGPLLGYTQNNFSAGLRYSY